jgi:predicted RNA-binding Zn ribbon-like protein
VRRDALIDGSAQPGGRAPAVGPLALVQAFVNTVDREHGPDLLDDAADLEAWLRRHGLGGRRPSRQDLSRAREVREALRTLLLAHVAPRSPVGSGPLEVLDAAAERARLRPRFGPARMEVEGIGVDAAVGTVLAAVFTAMSDGTWRRLKACPGHRCGWAFYDRSPNLSAAWCSMEVCGGRAKARTYYARRTAGDGPPAA